MVSTFRELQLASVVNSPVHIANKGRMEKPGMTNKGGFWNISGALSGPKALAKTKKHLVKKVFKNIPGKLYFITDRMMKNMAWIDRYVKPLPVYHDLSEIVNLKKGMPTERYIKDLIGDEAATSGNLHVYAQNQCFRWLSAVCPAHPECVRQMVSLTETFLAERGYRFRVTLTFVNPRSVIMISELDNLNGKEALKKAEQDYEECVTLLARHGYYAYWAGPGSYKKVIPDNIPLFDLLNSVKHTLDLEGILAPGKYTLE